MTELGNLISIDPAKSVILNIHMIIISTVGTIVFICFGYDVEKLAQNYLTKVFG